MKKTLILLFTVSLFILNASGQKKANFINAKMGAPYSDMKRIPLYKVSALPDENYLQVRYKRPLFGKSKEMKLEILNKSLAIVKEKIISLEYQGNKMDLESILMADNKAYLFTSYKNKETDIKYLFAQVIDLKTFEPDIKMKKIMEINYSNYSSANSGSYSITVDNASNNFLVYADLPSKKNEAESYRIVMLDRNMDAKWKLDRKLNFKNRSVALMGWEVDNVGNAFLTFAIKSSKKEPIPESEEGIYVTAITNDGTNEDTKKMDIKIGIISSLYYIAAENGKLIITGFYSEKHSDVAAGIFYGRYDATSGDFESLNTKKFSIDFITNNFSEREAAKTEKRASKGKEVGLTNYTVDKVIRRDDGGAAIIAEMFYWYMVTTTSSNGSSRTTYHYIYGNIAVINVNPDGTIDWNVKIPKYQHTINDDGYLSSYMYFVGKDGLYFIYNDHLKNLTQKEGKIYNTQMGGKNGVITVAKVTPEGKIERFYLNKYIENKILAIPKRSTQISPDAAYMQFFIPKGKKYKDVILTFEQ